ncbi:MAG: tetratricopeptide repeat protein [Syntrophobacteraceae bacterium]
MHDRKHLVVSEVERLLAAAGAGRNPVHGRCLRMKSTPQPSRSPPVSDARRALCILLLSLCLSTILPDGPPGVQADSVNGCEPTSRSIEILAAAPQAFPEGAFGPEGAGTAEGSAVPNGTAIPAAAPTSPAPPTPTQGAGTAEGSAVPNEAAIPAAAPTPPAPPAPTQGAGTAEGSAVPNEAAIPAAALAPPASLDGVVRMNKEVISLYRQGNYEEALAHCIETCEVARRELGEEHPEFGSCISNLALLYKMTGRYSLAEPLLKQSLEISRKVYGENDPDFVTSLNNLANFYSDTGSYAEAETLYLRALDIIRAGAGEENTFFVKSLNNLASLYKSMGNYVEVEPLYKKAAGILLRLSGEDQPDYAIVINNLAHYYYLAGRYPEAESTFRKSLDIAGKILGEEHPAYARTLINLGSVYEAMGNYAGAEPLYQHALRIFNSKSGKESRDAAIALNNLAGLYKTIGDYGKADSFYSQANDIRRAALGEKHPEYAAGLNNVADLYYMTGKFEAAEQLYLKVLEIQRSNLGEKHPDVALSMQNLAALYKRMGKYREAEPLYRQALGIWEPALGSGHPDVALALHNLGSLYHGMGKYGEAEPFYRRALEIRRAVLGKDHPDVAATLNNLAALCAAASRQAEALELMKQAQSINDRLIRHVFSFASESQRMGYIAVIRGEMDSFLSLISQYLANSPAAVMDGLDMVLKRKAIVAEALAARRDAIFGGRYPDLAPVFLKLRTLSAQIAQKIMSGPGPEGPEAHRRLLEKWTAEKESAEVFLADRIPEIDLERRLVEANREKVAKALPEGTVLVEFVRFDQFDFKAVPAQGQSPWRPARYLAFVLLPGKPENVKMIDLGEADLIDAMISNFRSGITGRTEKAIGHSNTARGGQGAVMDAGPKLREALFDPLEKVLDGHRQLILAPDGDIYRLPFGVLPADKERYIIEDYHISYVGAGRDIVRFGAAWNPGAAAPVVIADPDYDLEAGGKSVQTQGGAAQERQSRDMGDIASHFESLPGTRVEGEHIAAMLGVKALEGGSATKRKVEDARSPRILHLATHGFFLPDQQRPPGEKAFQTDRGKSGADEKANTLSRGMENPLLRSGLVLAGYNTWRRGKMPSLEAEDGILTAEDASGLDLLLTDLVVLSACQTGLGDIKAGEGVFGLRRAFLLAGAKTLLMSLWKIPDEETRMLMEGFYKRILEGRPRAEALREAQLEVKAASPDPLFWGAFISQGDPGPLPGGF